MNHMQQRIERCPVESREQQRGSALIMAVFVLALLTTMGTALLFMSQHESRMGRAGLHSKQAFYLAESGIEDGRVTLYVANVGLDEVFNPKLREM